MVFSRMNNSMTWLDRLLIAGGALVMLVFGLLAFTVLFAFLSAAALVLAVRGWWISRKLKKERPLVLEGDYRIVPTSRRE
ncbi:MAG: hypothetical protein ACREV9_08105 [Burkholderiales bacterium]